MIFPVRYAPALLLVLAAALSPLHAQVVDTPDGPLEFIGLKDWNARQLWDSIQARHPGEGVQAAAAALTGELGFVDAAVMAYPTPEEGITWVATVVEPSRAGATAWLPIPPVRPTRPEWREISRLLESHRFVEDAAVMTYGFILKGSPDSARSAVALTDAQLRKHDYGDELTGEKVDRVWSFLNAHRSRADRDTALAVLRSDGNDTNRRIATLLLASFPEEDVVWHALLNARRTRTESTVPRAAAGTVLSMFTTHMSRPVNWEPALDGVRGILGGANLFALLPTLYLLENTGFARSLAPPLLQRNTHLLRAYLNARNEPTREAAARFLGYLSGLGTENLAGLTEWLDRHE